MSIRAIGPVTGLERNGSRRMRRRLLPFSAVSVPVSDRPRTADRWQETSRPACRPRDRGTAAAGPVCSGPGRPPFLCYASQAFPRASACRRPAPCDVSSSPRCPHCSSAPAGSATIIALVRGQVPQLALSIPAAAARDVRLLHRHPDRQLRRRGKERPPVPEHHPDCGECGCTRQHEHHHDLVADRQQRRDAGQDLTGHHAGQ